MRARAGAQPSRTLRAAVENNARWCAAFCQASGVTGSRRNGVWCVDGPAPALYPEVVTLRPGSSATEVANLAPFPGSAVKDSFQDVDLAAEGFRPLFRASWLSLRDEDLGPGPGGQVSRACSADELKGWVSESGSDLDLPERLLDRPEFRALLVRQGQRVVAGATVFTTDGFAGVSNVFAHEHPAQAWSTLAHHLLADPLVDTVGGYEHGSDLSAALAAGARDLGPLTVWLRESRQVPGRGQTLPDPQPWRGGNGPPGRRGPASGCPPARGSSLRPELTDRPGSSIPGIGSRPTS